MPNTAPYGTWKSPIDVTKAIATYTVFDDVIVDPKTQAIYHLEESSDGRCVIFDTKNNKPLLLSPYSARTFVQEYGGAPAIVYDNIIYFSNDNGDPDHRDNKVYSLSVKDASLTPKSITPENNLMRYANFAIHPTHNNLLIALQEDHSKEKDGPESVINTICVIDTTAPGSEPTVIVDSAGFYACPVFNSGGTKVSWQQWDLPYMPWQSGIIYVADVAVEAGVIKVSNLVKVAGEGGTVTRSATFPRWIPGSDTKLLYIVDAPTESKSTYQNPFLYDVSAGQPTPVLKTLLSQDFSEPAWFLGQDPYAILDGGKYAAFTAFNEGRNILYVVDLTKPSDPVEIKNFDFVVAQHLRPLDNNTFVFTGTKSSDPSVFAQNSSPGGVIKGTVSGSDGSYTVEFEVLKSSGEVSEDLIPYLSKPIPMNLQPGSDNDLYVVLYRPKNPEYSGPIGAKPPCIIGVHGGPSALEPQSLNWIKMFYTSRGYAWLDVNYRGSSSYGRHYMDLLYGYWGIYDVEDCHTAAQLLGEKKGEIDVDRVAIRGGSAGGYTTLASITFAEDPIPSFYKTTCSAYGGVTDPVLLADATEKFECKWVDTLFGTSDRDKWKSRSPIDNIVDSTGTPNLKTPLLMLHGLADGVVPPEQARNFLSKITQQLLSQQIEFTFFPDEGHHYHQEKTQRAALEKESTWYEKNLL